MLHLFVIGEAMTVLTYMCVMHRLVRDRQFIYYSVDEANSKSDMLWCLLSTTLALLFWENTLYLLFELITYQLHLYLIMTQILSTECLCVFIYLFIHSFFFFLPNERVDQLDINKLLSISMDGPNVNHRLFELLQLDHAEHCGGAQLVIHYIMPSRPASPCGRWTSC